MPTGQGVPPVGQSVPQVGVSHTLPIWGDVFYLLSAAKNSRGCVRGPLEGVETGWHGLMLVLFRVL